MRVSSVNNSKKFEYNADSDVRQKLQAEVCTINCSQRYAPTIAGGRGVRQKLQTEVYVKSCRQRCAPKTGDRGVHQKLHAEVCTEN